MSWGWQKSLFTLFGLNQIYILQNRMFASHTRVHKKIHQKEIPSAQLKGDSQDGD